VQCFNGVSPQKSQRVSWYRQMTGGDCCFFDLARDALFEMKQRPPASTARRLVVGRHGTVVGRLVDTYTCRDLLIKLYLVGGCYRARGVSGSWS
jgi:hypothetical protein